jgi:hypothetical protein
MELVINEMKVQVTATDDGRRARAIIATKVGVEWINGKVYRNSSPERIRQELEDSLRRLGTDTSTCTRCTGPIRRSRSRRPLGLLESS